jgi:hypothetical protein
MLTLAGLYVELVAPSPILQAVDHLLAESVARIGPVVARAVVLDGGGVGPRIHPLLRRPVVHSQVVIFDRKGWYGAVDGWNRGVSH